jgi:hypothetical protein
MIMKISGDNICNNTFFRQICRHFCHQCPVRREFAPHAR